MSKVIKCTSCGRSFDEDELVPVRQWDGEGVMGGWHTVEDECPYCGNTDYMEDAVECCCCGEYFGKESEAIEVDDFWYCQECAKAIHDEYDKAWGKMRAC